MTKKHFSQFVRKIFTGAQDQYSTETLAEAINVIYQNQKTLTIRLALIPIILAFAFWDNADNTIILSWLFVALVFRALAHWQANYFLKQKFSPEETLRWGSYYTAFTFAFGLIYGGAALLFFTSDLSLVLQLFILLIIGGVVNGAITITTYWLASFYALMFPALGIATVQLLLQSDSSYKLLAILSFTNMIVVYSLARVVQKSLLNSIQLRFENSKLVEELKTSQKKAMEANQRKTRFLASASHDLRQPVHALELFTEVLTDQTLSPDRRNQTLVYLKESVASLSDLLMSLLDISRLDAKIIKPKMSLIDVSVFLKHISDHLIEQVRHKDLELRVNCQPCYVHSDSIMLENILQNLLANAIKYTHQGGILLACRQKSDAVWIEIWDTGIGIPKSEIGYIFDEFYQVDNAERDRRHGLGLGLAIVKREIKILSHEILLKSRQGRGTMVRLKLLSAGQESIVVEQQSPPKKSGNLAGINIIIIDDDNAILIATKMMMEQWGCIVKTATNLAEAEALCIHFTPDIIISDFRLKKNVTGIMLIDKLRSKSAHRPAAILITGDTEPDRLREAEDSGLILLHKPVRPAKLWVALNYGIKSMARK